MKNKKLVFLVNIESAKMAKIQYGPARIEGWTVNRSNTAIYSISPSACDFRYSPEEVAIMGGGKGCLELEL